jgi:beta-glucuronidase
MGCNYVRLAHYPHNEHMVRLADEMGIMVWAEIPVYWGIKWENANTYQCAENQMGEIITRDRNRACVILWSIANETPNNSARLAFLTSLADFTKTMDASRLTTAALNTLSEKKNTIIVDDPLGEVIDVIGCNEYLGWYTTHPMQKMDRINWESSFKKPMIMSEFGGGALQGYHGNSKIVWTEEYQERIYKHQTKMFKRIPFLRGTSPWLLMDFRSPRRPLAHKQDYWNRKGLVSDKGIKKKAFFVMRDFYEQVEKKGFPQKLK